MDDDQKKQNQPDADSQPTQPEKVAEESPAQVDQTEKVEPETGEAEDKPVTQGAEAQKEAEADAAEPVAEHPIETPAPEEKPLKSMMPDPNAPRWYVVHTYSGHEAKVAVNLKQRINSQGLDAQIIDILVPTQDKIEIHEGRKETVKEKIFPGYILVKMVLNDSTWLAVRSTPGVTSFVGIGDRPTPLPDSEVEMIQKFSQMEAPRYKTSFSVGEAVRINDGPFAEFLGTINEIDEARGKLKVMVSIFGRETPVELDLLQVSKL